MKNYLFIILLLIVNVLSAQEFKTSVAFGTGISWFAPSSSNFYHSLKNNISENGIFSVAIQEEYYMPKLISFGIELNCLNMHSYFSSLTPPENNIPEYYSNYQHSLRIIMLDVPIIIKIRTKKDVANGFYFAFGYGLNYIVSAKRNVEIYKGHMNNPKPSEIIPVVEDRIMLKTMGNSSLGTFSIVGIGKNFLIKNKSFFCEIKYRFDINSWRYSTAYDPSNQSIDLKRQGLILNLGYTF